MRLDHKRNYPGWSTRLMNHHDLFTTPGMQPKERFFRHVAYRPTRQSECNAQQARWMEYIFDVDDEIVTTTSPPVAIKSTLVSGLAQSRCFGGFRHAPDRRNRAIVR